MAQRGKHRKESRHPKFFRLVGGPLALMSALSLAIALLPQIPLLAAAEQETIQHWRNANGEWSPGAINAQNSTYAEGDVVPHWIEWSNATVGEQSTFSFSYEWRDASGNTGHDYLDDVNETEAAALVAGLSSFTIPSDPEVVSQLGAQPPGQFRFKGFTIDSVVRDSFDHGDREDKYYTFTVTFTEETAHLYYGAHLARDDQWPGGGAASFSGGNLENRFDRDGTGVGSSADQTVSIQVGAIAPQPAARVDIEKATNGEDADVAPGPEIVVGSSVVWTYVVTNIGDEVLTGVAVSDDRVGAILCPLTTLAAGESMECAASGTAVAGRYANVGTVTTDQGATDVDSSNYTGVVREGPGVDIEKATNGEDADVAPGPEIVAGSSVVWTYVVTNIGDEVLTGVAVSDDRVGAILCPLTTLAAGESMECSASGSAVAGQYVNVATVTTDQEATDVDSSHYTGRVGTTTTPTTPTTPTNPGGPLGSIGDFVWDDGLITGANGIQDAGEPGISGVQVNLYEATGTTKLASQVTDGDGKYLFTGVPAGSYFVEFVIPDGSLYSFGKGNPGGPDATDSDADPLTGRSGPITLSAGQNDPSWDAGLVRPSVLPQVITTTTTSTPLEALPFTGSNPGGAGAVALALLLLGSLVVMGARREAGPGLGSSEKNG